MSGAEGKELRHLASPDSRPLSDYGEILLVECVLELNCFLIKRSFFGLIGLQEFEIERELAQLLALTEKVYLVVASCSVEAQLCAGAHCPC